MRVLLVVSLLIVCRRCVRAYQGLPAKVGSMARFDPPPPPHLLPLLPRSPVPLPPSPAISLNARRAATASMRSKAHRRNAHELNTKEAIKSAARKLLLWTDSHSGGGSGLDYSITDTEPRPLDPEPWHRTSSGSGESFDPTDASFLARLSFM